MIWFALLSCSRKPPRVCSSVLISFIVYNWLYFILAFSLYLLFSWVESVRNPILKYYWLFKSIWARDFFRTFNVLPFSCTHLALWRYKGKVKDPRYMQNKKDSRISLIWTLDLDFSSKIKLSSKWKICSIYNGVV